MAFLVPENTQLNNFFMSQYRNIALKNARIIELPLNKRSILRWKRLLWSVSYKQAEYKC